MKIGIKHLYIFSFALVGLVFNVGMVFGVLPPGPPPVREYETFDCGIRNFESEEILLDEDVSTSWMWCEFDHQVKLRRYTDPLEDWFVCTNLCLNVESHGGNGVTVCAEYIAKGLDLSGDPWVEVHLTGEFNGIEIKYKYISICDWAYDVADDEIVISWESFIEEIST